MAKIRIRNAGKIVAWLIRGIAATLKVEFVDRAGILHTRPRGPLIWAFWHNRMFLAPWMHHHIFPHIHGCILSSASGDGQVIADICAEFGFVAARGSSSRKGIGALVALAEAVKEGLDIGITPDGPRGPCYQLNPGIIKLAQLTGVSILPMHFHFQRTLKMPTWDRFELPLPFSRVRIVLDSLQSIPRRMTEEEFEVERAKLEASLRQEVVPFFTNG